MIFKSFKISLLLTLFIILDISKSFAAVEYLTLFDAIDKSLKNNYNLKIAEEKINFAHLQVNESFSSIYPQLSVSTSYGRQDPVNPPQAPLGLGNNPQFAAFLGTEKVNTFRNQILVNQIIFDGFKILDGIKAAKINIDIAKEIVKQVQKENVFNISNAYFNSLKLAKIIEINQEFLKQGQLNLSIAKKRKELGVAIKSDVIKANNQLVSIQLQLNKSINEYNKSKRVLNSIMGVDIDNEFVLNTKAEIMEYEYDKNNLLKIIESHSEIKQINLKKEINQINLDILSRNNLPIVSANISYNFTNTGVLNSNNVNNQNILYGLEMNWNVFDGLLTKSRVDKAKNEMSQDEINLKSFKDSIILELRQAITDYEDARNSIILLKDNISLSEELLRVELKKYEYGTATINDVSNAQIELNKAKINLVNGEYDINLARTKLINVIGE